LSENPMINTAAQTLRAKKLGVLMKDARLAAGKSVEETAAYLGLSSEQYDAYEMGYQSPSLPELEMLAYFLNVPPDHFLEGGSLMAANAEQLNFRPEKWIGLRQRIVGLLLRQARQKAGLSQEELAEKAGIDAALVDSYEMGETPVPVPHLEAFASLLNCPVQDFRDQTGPLAEWAAQQQNLQDFKSLPPDLQRFVSRPVNRPYLELAQRLSEMDVKKLRAVAEGLLEITL